MRTFPKSVEQFLRETQQHVREIGKPIEVRDGSKELLILFGSGSKEWALSFRKMKFPPQFVKYILSEEARKNLADHISNLTCLRENDDLEFCFCGRTNLCIVDEVLSG